MSQGGIFRRTTHHTLQDHLDRITAIRSLAMYVERPAGSGPRQGSSCARAVWFAKSNILTGLMEKDKKVEENAMYENGPTFINVPLAILVPPSAFFLTPWQVHTYNYHSARFVMSWRTSFLLRIDSPKC